MSKAKDYIEAYTKRCGNDEVTHTMETVIITFHPWLTPENALAAVEIERQEVIEEIEKYISELPCKSDGELLNQKMLWQRVKQLKG